MAAPTVADVMHRGVPVVRADAPYKEVAIELATHHARALLVLNAEGKPIGIISESDLIERPADSALPRRFAARWHRGGRPRKAHARTATSLMTRRIVHVAPNTSLSAAARLAIDADVRQLPVLDGDAFIGMIDRADLLAGYLRSDDSIRDEIINRVIVDDFCLDPGSINVVVRDGTVVLSGCVEHRPLAEFLSDSVGHVSGVVYVENRLSWRHDAALSDPRRRGRLPC
jgi:CBS domain-containing protein